MNKIFSNIFNNYSEPVCVLSGTEEILYKNKPFDLTFLKVKSFKNFKNRFNFDICPLSTDNISELTPIDLLINSKENFHTVCTYQNLKDEYIYLYIYSFDYAGQKVLIFKDINSEYLYNGLERQYKNLYQKYNEEKEATQKFLKLQEHAQSQVLKMAIINKISLLIRETNDIDTIINSALIEINNLLGSYKTYFSIKEKNGFRIKYSSKKQKETGTYCEYEEDVNAKIKNKEISFKSTIKEYLNSDEVLPRGIKRIIIPVYDKNTVLGIIVSFTKQRFSLEENIEILQPVSVQLSGTIIQAKLIEQLNKKNKKLEKTLSELKETQLQLINSEKMASLGQLVSGVAHEINTPLASINSNSNLIKKIVNSDVIDKEKLKLLKELNSIDEEAVRRISDIVVSLKKFVRLDEAEFQHADINNELDLTLKLINHEIKNNIKIEKKYTKLPSVLCSVNMLNQVFMNLLINASQAIKESKKDGIITITTYSKENNLYVKIKDNGNGIPKESQNKIFMAGYTTKKKGVGTGLGLSISKKIVELHKGSISFISKENQGSEFTVCIPLKH